MALIKTSEGKPSCNYFCTLTPITETQLVVHTSPHKSAPQTTWILDLTSMSWRQCSRATEDHHPSLLHTYTRCLSSSVIGGVYCWRYLDEDYDPDATQEPMEKLHVILEAKTLQQLAIQTIYKHKHALPWQETLPRKLTCLFV